MSDMTSRDAQDFRRAVFALGNIMRASIETIGMQAENQERLMRGQALAYDEEAFMKVITDCGIDHNSLVENCLRG